MKVLLIILLLVVILLQGGWIAVTPFIVEVIPDTPSYDLPEYEETCLGRSWDCDDIALGTILCLEAGGYDCQGVVGNLELVNESLKQCNHAWVIAEIDGVSYYYENGEGYLLDEQHAEGYIVTKKQLLMAMIDDFTDKEIDEYLRE